MVVSRMNGEGIYRHPGVVQAKQTGGAARGSGGVASYKGDWRQDIALSLAARILPGSGRAGMWP